MNPNQAPQLVALVVGQRVRQGPFNVVVTEEMVRARERRNEKLARRWQLEQERRRHLLEQHGDYFGQFQELKVRRRFVRRVFSILTLQLMYTAAFIAASLFVKDLQEAMLRDQYVCWIAIILIGVTNIAIECSECARHGFSSVACLIVMTVSLAYTSAWMSVLCSTRAVLLAVGLTALVTLMITAIATFTKFDLTKYPAAFAIVNLIGSLGLMTLGIMMHTNYMHWMLLTSAVLGSFLFSMYLFYYVQMIMGGRMMAVEPDEVVYATAHIFITVIFFYKFFLICQN